MSGWIPIDAEPQPLTPTQQRIKELLDAGKNVYEIVWAVHMGKDFVIDEIYQIRKKESMLNMGKLTDEQRKEIIERWKAGESQAALAKAYGVSAPSVCDIIKRYNKKTQINPEFDAAVDAMIAESKAADAEEKSANAEPDKLPGVVCRAIDAGFHYLADEIDKRRNRIEELESEIAEFEKDITALRKWREAHK